MTIRPDRKYWAEKLFKASLALVGSGPLRERLAAAALEMMSLKESDVPDFARARFEAWRAKVTSVKPARDEGAIAATTATLAPAACMELAEAIPGWLFELTYAN